jgi:hypothetical protein
MPAKHPPMPGTLASFAECGHSVFLVCNNCGRYIKPQFYLIAQKTGWRAMADEVGKRMRCVGCRQRGARFTIDRPPGQMGRHR